MRLNDGVKQEAGFRDKVMRSDRSDQLFGWCTCRRVKVTKDEDGVPWAVSTVIRLGRTAVRTLYVCGYVTNMPVTMSMCIDRIQSHRCTLLWKRHTCISFCFIHFSNKVLTLIIVHAIPAESRYLVCPGRAINPIAYVCLYVQIISKQDTSIAFYNYLSHLKRSGMTCVNKEAESLTCHSHPLLPIRIQHHHTLAGW